MAINGATGASYTLGTSDAGETLTVVQTETNTSGSASAESAATGVILAGGFCPADLFASTEDGPWCGIHPDHCWTDTSMTTNAGFGDAVAAVTDRSGNGHHAIQSTVSKRPVLR